MFASHANLKMPPSPLCHSTSSYQANKENEDKLVVDDVQVPLHPLTRLAVSRRQTQPLSSAGWPTPEVSPLAQPHLEPSSGHRIPPPPQGAPLRMPPSNRPNAVGWPSVDGQWPPVSGHFGPFRPPA